MFMLALSVKAVEIGPLIVPPWIPPPRRVSEFLGNDIRGTSGDDAKKCDAEGDLMHECVVHVLLL
jgi:hypothetical protein